MGAAAAVVGDSGARLPAWEAATPVNKQRSHTRQARPWLPCLPLQKKFAQERRGA